MIFAPLAFGFSFLVIKSSFKSKSESNKDIKGQKTFKTDYELAKEELTNAEKKHLERQKRNESYFIQKQIKLTHRQKIENFNKKLADLPEHNDIPKVGPG